jgi:hypothetical protein
MASIMEGRENEINTVLELLNNKAAGPNDGKLYERTMMILTHQWWYTPEQRASIQAKGLNYPRFSNKQKKNIKSPPKPQTYNEEDYDDCDGCPDGMGQEEWDEMCERQD